MNKQGQLISGMDTGTTIFMVVCILIIIIIAILIATKNIPMIGF